jgi:O-antigen ligase
VHGSFTHPILACVMILIAYRLHRWLTWKGIWNQAQDGLLGVFQRLSNKVRIPMSSQISIILLLAALLTISRGPWLGGVFGAVIAWIGHRPNPKRVLYVVIPVMLLAAVMVGLLLNDLLSPSPGTSLSYEAGTLLYRKSLLDRYIGFVMERPLAGWGLTTIPRLPGMESVDNGFLLMALEHGLPAMLLFMAILVLATISQIYFAMISDEDKPAIGFTFAGIYVMCFIAFTTVYIGAQTMPMIFLLVGWGESIRKRGEPVSKADIKSVDESQPFKRVIY